MSQPKVRRDISIRSQSERRIIGHHSGHYGTNNPGNINKIESMRGVKN